MEDQQHNASALSDQPSQPLTPEEREYAKRVQFFQAAEPLFERFGYRKTTVEEICEATQASKRTFYELFKDKADIFIQLLLHVTNEMIEDYKVRNTPESTAIQRLNLYLDAYMDTVHNRPVFRLILEDPKLLQKLTGGGETGTVQIMESVQAFTELIQYGIETGEFRPLNPDVITWVIHALMDGLYLLGSEMEPSEGYIDTPEFEQEVRAFILNGLGVRVPGVSEQHQQ
ncbi:MAG: TetR/AcrR family transcriptional regulator [bacterium]